MARESFATIVRRRLLGVGYIVVIFGLIALSVAFYNKAFTPTVVVKLHTDHTGNQLLTQSDVKERGIIVGSVRSVKSVGDGAIITLALDPARVRSIPDNVSAQILPKTLFGEQFVSLTVPDQPGPPIKAGATISQDRSAVALESEKVIGDLLPLLNAVKPAELNATLTAMATALKGRGAELGQTLASFDSYLKNLNSDASPGTSYTKQLVNDLDKLGQLSVRLNADVPDLVATLDNLQTNAKTLIEKSVAFDSLLSTANTTSNIISSFLGDNEQRLITVVDTSQSIDSLLAQYSPEYTCMLTALTQLKARGEKGISGGSIQLSAQLYLAPPGFGPYVQGNEPKIITGLGPNCFGMPNPQVPFKVPPQFRCVNDGAPLTQDKCAAGASTGFDQQAIGTGPENAIVNTIVAGTLGTTPDKVPSMAPLLIAPALRGEQVTIK
ncbi:MAG: MCE family protein [Actinomycetota bacterium]|nr:MCE family protein [Actinomycetota bacterium]